jgi:signal transduction histidine kinase
MLKIGSARALLDQDTSQADQILGQLEGDVEGTLVHIRRLVYNLRPPELDQLGLAGAIDQYVRQYSAGNRPQEDGSQGLFVNFEAPDHIPPLPAAVEVAAYRIVQESLNNVVRHAQAGRRRSKLHARKSHGTRRHLYNNF